VSNATYRKLGFSGINTGAGESNVGKSELHGDFVCLRGNLFKQDELVRRFDLKLWMIHVENKLQSSRWRLAE
jgi:hypothetical protein